MTVKLGGVVTTRVTVPAVTPAAPEHILSLRRWDASGIVGKMAVLTTGAPAQEWDPLLKRYARFATVSASQVSERIQSWIEPRAVVDPRYPASGLVVRLRDSMRLRVTGGPPPWSGACYGRATFGFRAAPGSLSSANTNGTPFIGFRCDLLPLSNVADPTWRADFVNWNSTQRLSVDTGVTAGTIRDLMIELNGDDQTIYYYIDGLLVHSYAPTANEVAGQSAAPAEFAICTEVNVSAGGVPSPTLKLSWHLGVGPIVSCLYHDA